MYESLDKFVWTQTADKVFSHVVYAQGFLAVAADGIYRRTGSGWELAHAYTGQIVCAQVVNNEPLFGTAQGTILRGSDWSEIAVGVGSVWLAGAQVVLANPGTIETFSGPLSALVSDGVTDIDLLQVHTVAYDDQNKCAVISCSVEDQPIFVTKGANGWTYNIVDLDKPAVALAHGSFATSDAIYSTTNYHTFNLLHTFVDFEPRALAYL